MGSHDKIGPLTSAARNIRAPRRRSLGVVGSVLGVVAFLAMSGNPARAATAPTLGTAGGFAVLAASEVTNTGPSVVTGNVGVHPGLAVTGFLPGIVVDGTIYRGGEEAAQAQADTRTAYNNLTSQTCDVDLTDRDLTGLTLTAGVYCFSSSAQLTGTLILDAQHDPNAVFIFLIGSTLTTGPGSSVELINEVQACNVFWQVGSSATLDTTTEFKGTIIANASITANTGADVEGRLLALTGAVTLDTNDVTRPACATGDTSTTPVPETTTTVPEPTTTVPETTTTVPDTITTVPETSTTVPDTTTTVPDTTTTVPDTSTTVPDTTTTVPETITTVPETITTVPDTTTTVPDQKGSTTLVAVGREPGREVVTAALRTGEDRTMPRTGSAGAAMTAVGLLAIVSGNLLLEARRRRPVAIGSSSPRRR